MCPAACARGPVIGSSPRTDAPRIDLRGGRSPSLLFVVSLPKALFWHGFPRNAEEAVRYDDSSRPSQWALRPPTTRSATPVFRLGIICNRIAIPYVTLYTTFRGWDAVPNGRSRGVGPIFASLPGPEHGAKACRKGFPDGSWDRSHCTAAARSASSHLRLDTRSDVPSRHPACCLSKAAPHSNSTLMSQPVSARTGIAQAGDRGPVQRDRSPTVRQHGSSFLYCFSQRAAILPTPFDHVSRLHRRSGPSPCGFWCPSRHAPTSTYVQRNCR